MTTGKQLAGLLLLTTALTFPGVALAQGTGGNAGTAVEPATDDQVLSDAEGVGDDQVQEQPKVSIPGGTITVRRSINRNPERTSTQVVNVLSTEDIARTGEGDIAGALGKVTGLSVVEGGKVFVRGLGDRYSLALLNGLPLPSPEPLSRVVPLDIFPTNVVASSLVQKTYSPNFPGEFGGGVINLTTTAVPDESFIKFSGSLSGDTETTFQNGYAYYGSETDWTGFDNGARDIAPALQSYLDRSQNDGLLISDLITLNPAGQPDDYSQVEEIARSLTPPLFSELQVIGDLRANFSAGVTGGTAFDIGDAARFGIIFTGSLSNKYQNRVISREQAQEGDTELARIESDFRTTNRALSNAMLGLGLEVDDHTFRLTNLFIRDTVKQASLADFVRPQEFEGFAFQTQNTAWFERQLIDSQFVGELDFGALSVDLRAGYARTDREAPYNLSYTYARDTLALSDDDPNNDLDGQFQLKLQTGSGGFSETDAQVVFADLSEELWTGGIDIGYELTPNFLVTVGYAYSDTERLSSRRALSPRVVLDKGFFVPDPDNPGEFIEALNSEQLRTVLNAVNLRTPSLLLNSATYNLFDVTFDDDNATDPAFSANLEIHAGYIQAEWLPFETLTVQGGVRYEQSEQVTTPLGALSAGTPVYVGAPGDAPSTPTKIDNWLPALTVTWEATDDLQLRASASKTLARPQFRELVLLRYFDPETNRNYSGNPFLQDSELINLEARAEYYLGRRNRVSLAGFYKDIDSPIESFISRSGGDLFVGYANAPSAQLYGGEADLQYYFPLFDAGGWLETKEVVFLANYTYSKSELSVPSGAQVIIPSAPTGTDAANIFDDGAPLVGQSDHLVNVQLGLEDVDTLQQFTVLLSYASDRVSFRGFGDSPDVIEEPGVNLDIVFRQGFDLVGADAELKLEARNLLGTRHQEFQTLSNGLRVESNTYDVGTSFGASLSVEF